MRRLYIFVSIGTIGLFLIIYFGVNRPWWLGLAGLALPAVIGFHVLCFLLFMVSDRRSLMWSFLVLLSSLLFWSRTFQSQKESFSTEASSRANSLRVLSYNVGNSHRTNEQTQSYCQWLGAVNADVMVLPEYSNYMVDKKATLPCIRKSGYIFHHTLNHSRYGDLKNTARLTVFSKYPIVFAKDTLFQFLNGVIRADIVKQGDTVSVFGVHLYSMSLELDKLAKEKQQEKLEKGGIRILQKIKRGFVNRSREVDLLMDWIGQSPYPKIVAGDFNETPYSYSYSTLRHQFANAFEEKGRGFGFTFNGIPHFIRIDHQFYQKDKMELLDFQTFRKVTFSDHFPLLGTYQLKK
ncbi:endonuclease/exonuclease/phosphatase family metal-dependent hydrolase [Dyadobacter jejuensis]|uniref:Endonuclease/exonuclease/phosphatase family metal-dependent hydrolase n=1 Tax=Dyadobacter jejuensis TaxID=1082580 RepID=A0A316AIF6_9BACT|nr:endonuclease/exonuclease/phosphatase family protein [Dyadobacter jejuensis]PWJ57431.1 endonuclease/exonuclease/phosphatase family metal-dependent hydrolase [Dyadobacter jejuensis]